MAQTKEEIAAYKAQWYAANKERISEERRIARINKRGPRDESKPRRTDPNYYKWWREQHKERFNTPEHKAKIKEQQRGKYERHKHKYLEKAKTPEARSKAEEYRRRRYETDDAFRLRRLAENNTIELNHELGVTKEALIDLRSQDCFYCGNPGGTIDHLVPRVAGGQDRLDNFVPACKSCNGSKGSKSLEEFYASKSGG